MIDMYIETYHGVIRTYTYIPARTLIYLIVSYPILRNCNVYGILLLMVPPA